MRAVTNIGLVLSISNRGSATFTDHNNPNTIRWARALRTVVSLSNRLSLDIEVFLVLSSSYSRLILVLAIASST